MLSQWPYSHERCEIPTKPLAAPCLCVLPPTQSQMQEDQVLILLINRKAGVKLKFLLSRSLSFTHSHAHTHTLIHRHSHTVSSISAASQQQVSEDRGHLCVGLPLFSSASGHLCWEKTGREEQPTDCLSAPTSTPPRHKISLIRMHLLRHHDLALSISPFSLFCSS